MPSVTDGSTVQVKPGWKLPDWTLTTLIVVFALAVVAIAVVMRVNASKPENQLARERQLDAEHLATKSENEACAKALGEEAKSYRLSTSNNTGERAMFFACSDERGVLTLVVEPECHQFYENAVDWRPTQACYDAVDAQNASASPH